MVWSNILLCWNFFWPVFTSDSPIVEKGDVDLAGGEGLHHGVRDDIPDVALFTLDLLQVDRGVADGLVVLGEAGAVLVHHGVDGGIFGDGGVQEDDVGQGDAQAGHRGQKVAIGAEVDFKVAEVFGVTVSLKSRLFDIVHTERMRDELSFYKDLTKSRVERESRDFEATGQGCVLFLSIFTILGKRWLFRYRIKRIKRMQTQARTRVMLLMMNEHSTGTMSTVSTSGSAQ